MRYTIVIPLLNQLRYTEQCVDSLLSQGIPVEALLLIDNGSTDETPSWLASKPEIRSIHNRVNLGCGGAWTQGALASPDSEWVVFLNNDIVIAHDAINAMLDSADRYRLDVVSPSLVEIDLDYDLNAFTKLFIAEMRDVVREGWFHGVAFAVRQGVFHHIGYLDTDRLLFGREDSEFLFRCQHHAIRMGTVGNALMHHFGSITQIAMKKEQGVNKFGDHRYFYSRIGLSWWGRQRYKFIRKNRAAQWARQERAAHKMTLHMQRRAGAWIYQ